MSLPPQSELIVVCTVLTKDQMHRLRARKELLTSKIQRVPMAQIMREVVEAGLEQIDHDANMIPPTSQERTPRNESIH